ncbi:MAG: hypothetical protein J6U05_03385 [Neisseriaceae bacterium]|nr:hypothetical protein [Neisseriaceae bacterium]
MIPPTESPLLADGSKILMFGLPQISCGSKSNIRLAMAGGVKTSSLDKSARHSKTSDL